MDEYRHLENTGGDLAAYLKEIGFSSRDNSRTPMQWDAGVHAGFTRGKPWIGLNPNYSTVNVAAEERDENSCLNYFRRLVRLRKENPVLVYGKYTLMDKDNPDVYAYTREWKGVKWLVVLNFSSKTVPLPAGVSTTDAKSIIDNYPAPGKPGELRAYEAEVYEMR